MMSGMQPSLKIMGIMNLTPDSFFSASRTNLINDFNKEKFKYADIIDIGCESTRPGAEPVSERQETLRLNQFLEKEIQFSQTLSIDTYKPNVAKYALEHGFNMINDISGGGNDDAMLELACQYDCPIIVMHMKGTPLTMQKNTKYRDIISELIMFFEKKINFAETIGMKRENLILDPGIGFGKCIEDNYKIIRNLDKFKKLNHPILIGLSRKSFLSINGDQPRSRLSTTLAATVIAIQKGVDFIRVHDVEETYKLKMTLNRINHNQYYDAESCYS